MEASLFQTQLATAAVIRRGHPVVSSTAVSSRYNNKEDYWSSVASKDASMAFSNSLSYALENSLKLWQVHSTIL